MEDFTSFDKVKNSIFCKLINTERNEEILKNIPHKEFEDLSIVFYYLVEENENETIPQKTLAE